jgi:FkbM family methyltransferase
MSKSTSWPGEDAVSSRSRKHSHAYYARKIILQIWNHPANQGGRLRAVGKSIAWQVVKRITGRPRIIEVYDGVRIYGYPDSASASNVIYFSGYYDWNKMLFMARYLRDGDGFLDCGANIGTYSLLAASCVGPYGHVDAVEPFPLSVRRLRENVALNGFDHVRVHPVAVSDCQAEVSFLSRADVSNRIATQVDADKPTTTVPSVFLDSLLSPGVSYALAKLDVEGAETRVLKGATRALATHILPVWQFEAVDHLLQKQGSSREELLRTFIDHDYSIASYDAVRNRLEWVNGRSTKAANLFAIARPHIPMVLGRLEGWRQGMDHCRS